MKYFWRVIIFFYKLLRSFVRAGYINKVFNSGQFINFIEYSKTNIDLVNEMLPYVNVDDSDHYILYSKFTNKMWTIMFNADETEFWKYVSILERLDNLER